MTRSWLNPKNEVFIKALIYYNCINCSAILINNKKIKTGQKSVFIYKNHEH